MHKRIITKSYLAEMFTCLIISDALVYMINMLSQVLASVTCGRDAFYRLVAPFCRAQRMQDAASRV
jgi:hypothetical protein